MQKQPSRGALMKDPPLPPPKKKKMQKIHRRTPTLKCNPNKAAMQLY